MNRIYVDEEFQSKLDQCIARTELCDANGRVLGIYIPDSYRERRAYERARADMTPAIVAELEKRSQEPGGFTTQEVLQKLRALEAQHAK
jgi:hypothetical protein